MDLNGIIDLVVQTLVLLAIGYAITSRLKNVDTKLEQVLDGQKHIEVKIAETVKDVNSNKEWGKDSKTKIEDLEKRVNTLEKDNEMVKAKISQ